MNTKVLKSIKKVKHLNLAINVSNNVAIYNNLNCGVQFQTDLESGNYDYDNFLLGLHTISDNEHIKINSEVFFNAPEIGTNEDLNKIITAGNFVTNDELRPAMCGIFLGNNGQICATDAHKLYFEKTSFNIGFDIIVSSEVVNFLKLFKKEKTFQILVSNCKSYVRFVFGEYSITSKLIDGKYPNYEAVIPKENPNLLEVNRKELLEAVKVLRPIAPKQTQKVTLTVDANTLSMYACDIDYNRELTKTMQVEKSNNDMQMAFSLKLLEVCLKSLETLNVNIAYSEPNRAIIINNSVLLMPIYLG